MNVASIEHESSDLQMIMMADQIRSSYILYNEVALLCFHVGKICTQSDLILLHTSNSLHE